MENNVLKLEITNTSLQMRCKGMWKSTNWKIYEDLTVEIFNSYDDENLRNGTRSMGIYKIKLMQI